MAPCRCRAASACHVSPEPATARSGAGRRHTEVDRSCRRRQKRTGPPLRDPFSVGSHYHIRPSLRGRQIPLWVEEGQKPLEIALAFFEKPLRFRGLLAQAEEDEVAARLDDSDLASAARQIRELDAAAA
jgi:hypothetical protein